MARQMSAPWVIDTSPFTGVIDEAVRPLVEKLQLCQYADKGPLQRTIMNTRKGKTAEVALAVFMGADVRGVIDDALGSPDCGLYDVKAADKDKPYFTLRAESLRNPHTNWIVGAEVCGLWVNLRGWLGKDEFAGYELVEPVHNSTTHYMRVPFIDLHHWRWM
jgi:hypothetical protein